MRSRAEPALFDDVLDHRLADPDERRPGGSQDGPPDREEGDAVGQRRVAEQDGHEPDREGGSDEPHPPAEEPQPRSLGGLATGTCCRRSGRRSQTIPARPTARSSAEETAVHHGDAGEDEPEQLEERQHGEADQGPAQRRAPASRQGRGTTRPAPAGVTTS